MRASHLNKALCIFFNVSLREVFRVAQGIISDNWSLQDISSLFVDGMENASADEITIANGKHSYKAVSYPSI